MHEEISWAVRHVLGSPLRMRYLVRDGASTPVWLLRFLRRIVPHASLELQGIGAVASSIPDDALRAQALASIEGKAFHVAGACILATFLPPRSARAYVELVAPLESIYDYLDNLCDRHPDVDPQAYPLLHQALADALDPTAVRRDYYALGPKGSDNGYLARLVQRVQRSLARIPRYELLLPGFREAATLYGELQTFKHLPPGEREGACVDWFARRRDARTQDLTWFEFACAAGSQFHVCAPLFELMAGRPESVAGAYDAHFPAVAAIHVLLDYFIDQAEDREHGELNFAAQYASPKQLEERFAYIFGRAMDGFGSLPHPEQHRFVLRVMTLFYLTHPKVYAQRLNSRADGVLRATLPLA